MLIKRLSKTIRISLIVFSVMFSLSGLAKSSSFIDSIAEKLPTGVVPDVYVSGMRDRVLSVSENDGASARMFTEANGRFQRFLRATIPNKGEHSHTVTAHSLANTSVIKKDDWVVASFYVRAAPGTGKVNVRGFIERMRGGWMMVADASIAAGEDWARVIALGRASVDLPKESIHLSLHLSLQAQTVDIADLAFLSLPAQTPMHVFPPTELRYSGMDANAPWRIKAKEMIKQHRSNNFSVVVLNQAGEALSQREISINLQDIDYELASMVGPLFTEDSEQGRQYQAWFNQFFNAATARIYWADWGWENPEVRAEQTRSMQTLQALNVSTRGHVLLYPAFRFSPESLNKLANDKNAFIARVNQHIDEIVPLLRKYGVNEYDVINELRDEAEWLNIVGLDTVADWFKRVHYLHPEAVLYINENSILTDGGDNKKEQDSYFDTIQYLIEQGAPIHGIGMQGHFSGVVSPVEKMWKVLDRFASFGLPIRITEYDSNTRDTKAQAQFDTDFFEAMYAHPATVGVTRWGFYEPKMWRPLGALIDAEGELKPNAVAYLKWLNDLKSNTYSLLTSDAGKVKFSGLYGSYEVRVKGESKVFSCLFPKPPIAQKPITRLTDLSCTIRLNN